MPAILPDRFLQRGAPWSHILGDAAVRTEAVGRSLWVSATLTLTSMPLCGGGGGE